MTWTKPKTAIAIGAAVLLAAVIAGIILLTLHPHRFSNHTSYVHPAEYTGVVWIKVRARPKDLRKPHQYKVVWGRWMYTNQLDFDGYNEACLVHQKQQMGAGDALQFTIDPPCEISFGQGQPTGVRIIDINGGWVQVGD